MARPRSRVGRWHAKGGRLPRCWRAVGGIVALIALVAAPGAAAADNWLSGGQNLQNTRNQASETAINHGTVATLAPKWTFDTNNDPATLGGDVSATPTFDENRLYFPDSSGNLYALDRSSGAVRWKRRISDATGIANDYARAAPALAGSILIVGTQSGKFETPSTPAAVRGAYVLGYDKHTGDLRWKTKIDDHFSTFVTQAAQVSGTTAYVGLASNEEAFANPMFGGQEYLCCSFRGSMLALDTKTGAIKWKTYMTPAGYSGAAVWGSTPAVDTKRGAVYIATGNNYSVPDDAAACVDAAGTREEKWACMEGNEFDAIVALDLKTGAIRWSFKALPSDAWNTDCGLPGFDETVGPNCPEGVGPDYDFGQAPMLFSATVGGQRVDLVGAGSKSGVFSTVSRDTGELVWDTTVGNGGLLGGLQWGSATDGERIYVAESNSTGLQRGAWSALDPGTGEILWETPDPGAGFPFPFFPGMYGYSAQGPVSVANGLVYGCSLSLEGPMVAMNAATGDIEWKRDSGSSCIGGASIGDGTVYWGTGYRSFAPVSSAGDRVFAFTPNGG